MGSFLWSFSCFDCRDYSNNFLKTSTVKAGGRGENQEGFSLWIDLVSTGDGVVSTNGEIIGVICVVVTGGSSYSGVFLSVYLDSSNACLIALCHVWFLRLFSFWVTFLTPDLILVFNEVSVDVGNSGVTPFLLSGKEGCSIRWAFILWSCKCLRENFFRQ